MEQNIDSENEYFEEWNIEDENLESPERNKIKDTHVFVNNLILNKGKWNNDDFKIELKTTKKVCNPIKKIAK